MDSPAEVFFSPYFEESVSSGNCCRHLDHADVAYVECGDHIVGLMVIFEHGIAVDEEQGSGDGGSLEQPVPVWLGLF